MILPKVFDKSLSTLESNLYFSVSAIVLRGRPSPNFASIQLSIERQSFL